MSATANTTPRAIEPFWQRLPKISAYPLQGAALATIVLLAFARLSIYTPIMGWALNFLVTVGMYKFAAEVLWRTANGRMTPPENYSAESNLGWLQVGVQLLLWGMVLLGFWLFGRTLGFVAAIFIALGAPGAMMSAAIDGDLGRAINPASWIAIMTRVGWPYFVVAALCLVFMFSEANAQRLLVPLMPEWMGIVVFYFISHYVTVATFHLMGYLVYQYHDELGYDIEEPLGLPPRPGVAVGADADQGLLDEAEALVRDDRAGEAEDLLREQIATRGATPAVHQRYRKLLALRGDRARLISHAHEFLNVLMAQDDERRAVELVREAQEIDPAFKPTDAAHVARIAERAVAMGQAQVALRLLSGFHKAFPKHADIPRNYLLAAKLMAERFNREEQARAMLAQVRQQFPQHPLVPEIDRYLAFLDTLSSTARPVPPR